MRIFYQYLTGKIPVFHVKDSYFLFSAELNLIHSLYYKRVKRLLDIAVSLVGLLISLPVLLFTALAIKIDSRGPVFFGQERVGLRGQKFTLLKLRTMVPNAEALTGPKWAEKDDPRVTRVGKLLRKTRIDEVPQLINILKGDMSFVGPRPIRKYFLDQLAESIPFYHLRHSVKPGLTGWAQVCYNYASSEEDQSEKLQYDLYYIHHMSFFFDLFMSLKTIQTLLFRHGQ